MVPLDDVISGYASSPPEVTIQPGTTGRRVNEAAIARVELADDLAVIDVRLFEPGWLYEQTFDRPGVDRDRCGPHPDKKGSVIVE